MRHERRYLGPGPLAQPYPYVLVLALGLGKQPCNHVVHCDFHALAYLGLRRLDRRCDANIV